jgi:hypothetical protein
MCYSLRSYTAVGTEDSALFASFAALCSVASAHFQLQFPAPRGAFNEDDEPGFCDGYTHVTKNRTAFPLNNGFVAFKSEHENWTFGALVSTASDPASFNDFPNATMPLAFFKGSGENVICAGPLSFNATSDIKDGTNATIQLIFDGGDGQLYQCADVTLSANATVPSDFQGACDKAQGPPSPSATGPSSSTPTGSGVKASPPLLFALLGALIGLT